MLDISIVGAGRMGLALALGLDRVGCTVSNLIYRSTRPASEQTSLFRHPPLVSIIADLNSIPSDIILITTQDHEIAAAAAQIEPLISGAPAVLITSGAHSSRSIENLRDAGCRTGSMHPLVSISDPFSAAAQFKDVFFCLEGEPEAVAAARSIVKSLAGHPFSIATDKKPLYHAAAVTSSGHFVALIDMAIGMLGKCGLDRDEGKRILLPLIDSTLENIREQRPEDALTGTFARGDPETFLLHMSAFEDVVDPVSREIYLDLGNRSIDIARRRGANLETLDELQKRVLIAKRELR